MRRTPRQNALRMNTKFNIRSFSSPEPLGLICNRPRDQETTGSGDENDIRSAFYFRSSKQNISVASSLKAKREKQTKKGATKITSFETLYIFLASNFCTTWLSVCTSGENDV